VGAGPARDNNSDKKFYNNNSLISPSTFAR
jgi:hypothetical protein